MKSHLDEDRDAGWSVERFLKGIIRSDFENPIPSEMHDIWRSIDDISIYFRSN